MAPATGPRIVVGIDDSLAGLRALRQAVTMAGRLGASLHAVRVLPLPPAARGPMQPTWQELRDCGHEFTDRVFATALGGVPPALTVEQVTVFGRTGHGLTGYAHRDEDLLVVGADRGGLLRRLLHPRVARYCASHATCPVLVVPPQELARCGSPRALSRTLSREIEQEIDRLHLA